MELDLLSIRLFSKIKILDESFIRLKKNEQQNTILNILKNENWSKGLRIEYNTWLYYKKNNYEPCLVKNKKKYYIDFNHVKIKIRIQDFFHIKIINELLKKKDMDKWFNLYGYIDYDRIYTEKNISTHKKNKKYRPDYTIKISGNNYFCMEFFEDSHYNQDDLDFKKEKNRIYSILYESDDDTKILFFAIYWEKFLLDDKYFNNFVKTIYKKIKEYEDIDDEKKWCIKGINKYIKNEIISESIYNSHEDENKTVIDINEIDKVIGFRDDKSKKLHYTKFIKDIDELINFDNNEIDDLDLHELNLYDSDDEIEKKKNLVTDYIKDNKLSLKGLNRYLKIDRKYLINIREEENLLRFQTNITKGFVYGIKKQRDSLLNLQNNKILFIDDY